MRGRLGLVTIGQAPRSDLIPDVRPLLARVEWVEHGALDLIEHEEIAALVPRPGETELVSRLRDGTGVRLAEERLRPHVSAALQRCVEDGCSAVLVLCTGRLGHASVGIPVLHSEELAHEAVAELVGDGSLAVVCPTADQVNDVRSRWTERLGRPVLVEPWDPYQAGSRDGLVEMAGHLVAAGADRLYLDCMGYTLADGVLAETAGRPVSVARAVAVSAAVSRLTD